MHAPVSDHVARLKKRFNLTPKPLLKEALEAAETLLARGHEMVDDPAALHAFLDQFQGDVITVSGGFAESFF